MKLSIVVPVLNSHEILRRQFIHWGKFVNEDTEIIIVDDGSDPPLRYDGPLNVRIIHTNDTRPWTWALARNRGAKEANGEYLVMFDLDHIILPDALEMARTFGGYKIQFKRQFGILDEIGNFSQERDILTAYGLPKDRGIGVGPLPNNFIMRKDVFWDIGGYREDLVTRSYPQGEDRLFKKAWYEWERKTGKKVHHERPTIYLIPNGYFLGDVDADPMNLFHKLSRKTRRNHKYVRQNKGTNTV